MIGMNFSLQELLMKFEQVSLSPLRDTTNGSLWFDWYIIYKVQKCYAHLCVYTVYAYIYSYVCMVYI